MGQILSQPETEKHSEKDADAYLAYGLSCMQGWRINMEDAHATILDLYTSSSGDDSATAPANSTTDKKDPHTAFFGVYDGHGGEKAAIFTGRHLHELVRATAAFQQRDYASALKDGFLSCDEAILQDEETLNDESGCAATAVIVTPSEIFCGNAGDSRTVMSIDGYAKALSYDHKPMNEGEKARICAAGGYVDVGRVNGNLALSRGIGDFVFKKNADLPAEEQIVTCYPDVLQHTINYERDEFIILACDGIWDCLTSQQCVECVRRGVYERKPFTQICEEIMDLCCAPTSDGLGIGCDNMSILIVALLDQANGETLDQWYDRMVAKVDEHDREVAAGDAVPQHGPISPPYNDLYKEIFGEFYDIGQQGQDTRASGPGGYSMFGNIGMRGKPDDDEEADDGLSAGAISLQKLLSSNVITNENGVIYLDTSSAQSLLASFGVSAPDGDTDITDVVEDDDDTVQKHIEEVVEEEEESSS